MNGVDGQNKPTEENNMRQNRILNYIGAASLLLAVCACGKEDLNTTTDTGNGGTVAALPEGTFVVDYSVSDGETSRAGEKGRPNTSISSLLYLLYDSEGKLVKEREIPGIGTDTKWPLTRENMSWEQREALKDTLNSGSTYTAVFLANVKKDLFGNNTQTEELLQNKENLTEAVLYLPQTPFKDSNMYYLWKDVLKYTKPENASDDSRDNPLSKKIILRRLVSRIDMERVAITDETDAVKAGMGTNFDDLLVKELNAALVAKVDDLKDDLKKLNVVDDKNCQNLLNLLQEKVGTKGDKTTIAGKNYGNYINQLVTNFKEIEIANYDLLVSSWTAFTTSEFTLGRMHNRMSINDLTSSYDSNITSPTYTYQVTDGKATWIGFACNEDAKMSFTGITLKGETETAKINLIFDESKEIFLQKNGLVTCICNPIAEIEPKELSVGKTYSGSFGVTINMEDTYGSLDDLLNDTGFSLDDIDAFKAAINNVFDDWDSDVSLSIKIPSSTEFTYTTTIKTN